MSEFRKFQEQVVPDFADGEPDPDSQFLCDALRDVFAKRKNVVNIKGWLGENADELRIPEPTFKKIVYGHQPPSGARLLRMFKHFGPAFTSDVLAHIGMECAWSHQITAVQEGNRLAKLENFVTAIGAYADDLRSGK